MRALVEKYKALALNAALAGFWTGVAIIFASAQPLSKAAIFAAGAAAIRAAVGYVLGKLGHPVPVDS